MTLPPQEYLGILGKVALSVAYCFCSPVVVQALFLEVLFFKIFFPIIGAVHYAFCLVSISVIILV